MTDVRAILAQAIVAHRGGRIEAAIAGYRSVVAADPDHPQANHLLGFALLQSDAPAQAEPLLAKALRRSPLNPEGWAHLGLAQLAIARIVDSETALRRASILAPGLLDAHEARIRIALGNHQPAAENVAGRAVALAPLRPTGWHGLGLARARRRVGAPAPDNAVNGMRRSLVLDPAAGTAASDLADMLRSRHASRSAQRLGRQALQLTPGSPALRATMSAILFDLDRVEDADRMARSAAVLAPGTANAYGNRAQCHYRRAHFDKAIADGRRAVQAGPDDRQIQANLGSYLLASGNLDDGWALFGHRPTVRAIARSRRLPGARWTGETGARLLVLAEQGLGDEILFASCWPDLAAAVRDDRLAAARVEIDRRLRPLAERSFPELEWLDRNLNAGPADGARRSVDFAATHWIAAGDLPAVLRHHIDDFPRAAGYLVPDPVRVARYRHWLAEVAPDRRRLGLCWRSGLRTDDRVKYYPTLAECRALLTEPQLTLIVLQYDDCSAEVAALDATARSTLVFPPDLDRRNDLDGVAALMKALDGLVTAQTAVQALAGAVGAPTVGFDLGSTWVDLGQDQPPWYPSVTNLHRRIDETWEQLLARVAEHVR